MKRLQASSRACFQFLVLLTLHLALVSCGFHLRESGKIAIPADFSILQVKVDGEIMQYSRLLVAMNNALRSQTDVQIQESGDAPRLVLYGEKSDSRVLSVTSFGKVDEYLLKYEVSFRLVDSSDRLLSPSQTIKVQRDHQFDRLNVLAKEREQQELRTEMQRDAVQQIVLRLSRIKLIAPDANQP